MLESEWFKLRGNPEWVDDHLWYLFWYCCSLFSFFLRWPVCNSINCFLLITFYCHLLFHQVISLLPLDSFLSLLHQLLADTERDMQKKSIAILSARLENPRTKFTSQHVSPIAALCGDVACWWVHYGHVLLYIQFSVTDLYRDVIQLVYS